MSARALAIVLVVAIAVPLAAIQALASIALRGDARGAWPHLVSPGLATRVDQLGPSVPVPPALRLVLAREAFARGDVALAALDGATLPASRDRLALEGDVADARGDAAGAVRAYLDAGDLSGVEHHVDELLAVHREPEALALQRAVVARLLDSPGQADALALAYFDLGRVEEAQAYRLLVGSNERREHENRAADAYAQAVARAPFEERYLIAYANQQLNIDDIAAAERAFERARDADPTSAEPLAGLGDAAFSRGDVAAARDYLARARVLDPNSDAVRRLARELDD